MSLALNSGGTRRAILDTVRIQGAREIHQGSVDEQMDREIASKKLLSAGPDLQRFLEDAAAATAEFARKTGLKYVIPSDRYWNRASGSPDVECPYNLKSSLLTSLASCCNAGRRMSDPPEPKKRIVHPRGWKTAPYILGCEIGEKLGSTVVCYSLIVYLTNKMNLSLVKSVYISSVSFGVSSLAPLLGVFLSEAYLGHFTTVAAGSIFYLGGLVLFTLLVMEADLQRCEIMSVVGLLKAECSEATSFQMTILFLSLTLQTMGSGGIRPCAASCAADQFEEGNSEQQQQIQNFFSWNKACMASAMMVAATVAIWIQINVGWGWGFLMLSIAMGLPLSGLLIGIPFFRSTPANGSPLTSLVQVLVAANRNRHLSLPANPDLLYEGTSESVKDILPHTDNMRWLDKAAVLESWSDKTKDHINHLSNPWRLCTVQQVEELKKILRMAPIWICTSVAATVYIQNFTIVTKQAMTMDLRVGKHFEVPAASMGAFSILSFLFFTSVHDTCLIRLPRKLTGQTSGLTCLRRIGVGIFIGILTMATAAILETKRRNVAIRYHISSDARLPISGFWLVAQFLLTGLGESFMVPGILEFFNNETPPRLHGMGKSFVWAALGIAGLLNAILVSILQSATETPNSKTNGWLHASINKGRLDYFYCTLGVVEVVIFIVYISIASSYTYIVKTDLAPGHTKLDSIAAVDTIEDSL